LIADNRENQMIGPILPVRLAKAASFLNVTSWSRVIQYFGLSRRLRYVRLFSFMFVLLYATTAEPLAARLLPVPPSDAEILRVIAYKRAGAEDLKLDLYLPRHLSGKPRLILCIDGGGWSRGNKRTAPELMLLTPGTL
jgi:acetyl esterase/lipase